MSHTFSKPRVALIGVGLMGSRMAARLLAAGFPLSLRDSSPEKCRDLESKGARNCQSIAEAVADTDIILTSLAGSEVINEVYFGEDGITPNAPKDSLLIDMSSLAPDLARRFHQRLSDLGYSHHLDAPVSGGVSGAESGNLAIMVGGDAANLERARPVLEVLGEVFHLGGDGAGQVCKMVNQAIVHVSIGAVTEGLLLAAASGVDAGKVREAISGGYCKSRILDIHGGKIVNRDFLPGGPLEYSVKDMDQAVTSAREAHLTLPLSQKVLELYEHLLQSGRGRLDHSALLLAYEEENPPIRVSADKEDILP